MASPSPVNISAKITMDFSKMKVPDLKKELKSRGLNLGGNKNDLIERLQRAMQSNSDMIPDNVDELDEDLLIEEDDDGPLESTESVISDIDSALSESGTPLKRKLTENGTEKKVPTKKITLNRTAPVIAETVAITKPLEIKDIDSANGSEANSDSIEKKVKITALTAKERMEMRAKKFDVTLATATDDRKTVRAERFKITSTNTSSAIDTKVNTSVDVLKQRAERFGGSVSKVMSNIDLQEKLEKRKARFGIVTPEDKAKQRLERFKQPVK